MSTRGLLSVGGVVLGLLGACPSSPPRSASMTPTGVASVVASAQADDSLGAGGAGGAPTEPPFADVALRPSLTVVLSREGFGFGFQILGAPKGMKAPVVRTRGGYEQLNLIAAKLEALAAACRCTNEPLPLLVADEIEGPHVWSVLGLIEQVGFLRVEVTHRGQTLQLDLELSQPTPDPKQSVAFRFVSGVRKLGAPPSEPAIDVGALCSSQDCAGATLLLTEHTPMDMAWRAAQAVVASNRGRVALRFDSLPRPAQPKWRGRARPMLAPMGFRPLEDRAAVEYAPLYACLTQFPVATDGPLAATFATTISPEGKPSDVKLHKLQVGDAPPPPSLRASAVATTDCLRKAVGKMSFGTPQFGEPVKVGLFFFLNR